MSQWEELKLASRVEKILKSQSYDRDDEHHLLGGGCFLTSYQIACILIEQDSNLLKELDLQLGGEGTGEHKSLAQYVARNLSQYCLKNPTGNIEGAFLSTSHVVELEFIAEGLIENIRSSIFGEGKGISMFRLRS